MMHVYFFHDIKRRLNFLKKHGRVQGENSNSIAMVSCYSFLKKLLIMLKHHIFCDLNQISGLVWNISKSAASNSPERFRLTTNIQTNLKELKSKYLKLKK